jgi:hypothetical protein
LYNNYARRKLCAFLVHVTSGWWIFATALDHVPDGVIILKWVNCCRIELIQCLNDITSLKHNSTSWMVAGSTPEEVFGFFNLGNPSSCTMVLGSTQPLTEISTRNFSGSKGLVTSS